MDRLGGRFTVVPSGGAGNQGGSLSYVFVPGGS
jgi:hypothetical protein